MQDSMRMSNLKEKSDLLNYSTKPTLNDTSTRQQATTNQVANRQKRTRSMSASNLNQSLSTSGLFELSMNKKYAHVKPKTQTRVPLDSARAACDDLNESRQDVLNDSSCLRQTIYNEWYYKKIQQARQQLKEAQLAKKDEEEKKAQVNLYHISLDLSFCLSFTSCFHFVLGVDRKTAKVKYCLQNVGRKEERDGARTAAFCA